MLREEYKDWPNEHSTTNTTSESTKTWYKPKEEIHQIFRSGVCYGMTVKLKWKETARSYGNLDLEENEEDMKKKKKG